MVNTPYIVSGRSDSGIVAPRVDILNFVWDSTSKNNTYREQWSLFVVAFLKIQSPGVPIKNWEFIDDIKVPAGAKFEDIAGIHGLPYQTWPGDIDGRSPRQPTNPPQEPGQAGYGGYCNHGAVTFPTWHRPYLLLFEQSIGQVATAIAQKANNPAWIQAAKQLRMPYWDWSNVDSKTTGIPGICHQQTVKIAHPTLTTTTEVQNPLFAFSTPNPQNFMFEDDYSVYRRTYRQPFPENGPNPNEDYNELNSELNQNVKVLRAQCAALFTFPTTPPKNTQPAQIWDEFSNTDPQSFNRSPFGIGPIEQPHNSVHVYVGGSGHMSDPDYAAFDPIFFLHHANVDRLYALWEYIYPDYWMGNGYKNRQGRDVNFIQGGSTWDNEKPDYTVNQTSDLRPFPISQSGNTLKHWNSNDTRFLNSSAKTPKFYTYPTIAGVSVETPTPNLAQREALRAKLQQHFGLNPIDDSKKVQSQSLLFKAAPPAPPPQTDAVPGWQRFFVDAELNPGVTDGSHMLELSAKTATGTIPMGHVSVFSRGKGTKCAACKVKEEDPDHRIHGIIPISTLGIDRLLSAEGYKPVSEKADMEHVISKLRINIRAAGPHRKVLAHNVKGGHGHEDEVHPVKRATIITAHVAKPAGNPEGAATFYNFREWADLNEGRSWRAGPKPAQTDGGAQQPIHS